MFQSHGYKAWMNTVCSTTHLCGHSCQLHLSVCGITTVYAVMKWVLSLLSRGTASTEWQHKDWIHLSLILFIFRIVDENRITSLRQKSFEGLKSLFFVWVQYWCALVWYELHSSLSLWIIEIHLTSFPICLRECVSACVFVPGRFWTIHLSSSPRSLYAWKCPDWTGCEWQ